MPNWCVNKLIISGREADLNRFVRDSARYPEYYKETGYDEICGGEKKFSFHGTVPLPEEMVREMMPHLKEANRRDRNAISGTNEPVGDFDSGKASLWYGWCSGHWGTKWDAAWPEIKEENKGEIIIDFETPWGPPDSWLDTAAEGYPELTFVLHYDEEGNELTGTIARNIEGRDLVLDRLIDIG